MHKIRQAEEETDIVIHKLFHFTYLIRAKMRMYYVIRTSLQCL